MGEKVRFKSIGAVKSPEQFKDILAQVCPGLPIDMELQTGPQSPLAQEISLFGRTLKNRFAIHPMEGWDADRNGNPGPHTLRRWQRFGESGAALIWGGEAVSVQPQGRANPNQLLINDDTLGGLVKLRESLVMGHQKAMGSTKGLLIGLQLTHSGRFSRPIDKGKLEARIAYPHPILDKKFAIDPDTAILKDEEIDQLIEDFIQAGFLAWKAGYAFVDIKHCHGYLLHEFLGAKNRSGPYGGSYENRTRILREVVKGLKEKVPDLGVGVRLSAFDMVPYGKDTEGAPTGIPNLPEGEVPPFGFAMNPPGSFPVAVDESEQFLNLLKELGVGAVNLSAGSPYYNPHIQRPASYPPSDGYLPPEDPLVGVHRQMLAVKALKERHPDLVMVGSAYTYFQQFLPLVAQAAVAQGWVDVVGLGRMVLSYPDLPADVLTGAEIKTKLICRTFSDCTTAPRNGILSGCFPLDPYYKEMPEAEQLKSIKQAAK